MFAHSLSNAWLTFSRARALVGLGRFEEARDAVVDGLQFEPDEKVRLCIERQEEKIANLQDLNSYLEEVNELIRRKDAGEMIDDDEEENGDAAKESGVSTPVKSGTASPVKKEEASA